MRKGSNTGVDEINVFKKLLQSIITFSIISLVYTKLKSEVNLS